MRKVLLLVGIGIGLVVTTAVATYFISRPGTAVKEERASSVTAQPLPKKDLPKSTAGSVGEMKGSKRDVAPKKQAKSKKPESPAVSTTPEGTLAVVKPEEKSVRVNDTPVTIDDVIPPSVLQPGDEMPEDAAQKLMDLAEDQQLLVQEAQRFGMADTPEYQEMVEDMRNDLAEMSGLSDEERQWRLDHFSKRALINELYRQEGLIPERVSKEELDEYYETYSHQYEWVREREALKGRSPDQIERKVKKEMQRDLKALLNQDLKERRQAYIESLRQGADIR